METPRHDRGIRGRAGDELVLTNDVASIVPFPCGGALASSAHQHQSLGGGRVPLKTIGPRERISQLRRLLRSAEFT